MHRYLSATLFLIGMLAATPTTAQPSGGGHPSDRRPPQDDPTVLSPPIVMEPIYECSKLVGVRGFVPHAKLVVFVNGVADASATGLDPNGHQLSLSAPTVAGQVITATQEVGGVVSAPSAPVVVRDHTVDYPSGLPASKIDPPPLYQCGIATASHYHVPTSVVDFFSQPSSGSGVFTSIAHFGTTTDWTWDYVSSPFSVPQAITTQYSICSDHSPMSGEELVIPEPATIPAPTVGNLYENGEVVGIGNLLNGAMVEVTSSGAPRGSSATCCSSIGIRVSPPLVAGEAIAATQKLCHGGPPGTTVTVQPCSALPPPRIRDPEIGDTTVEVIDSVAGARILVYDGALHEIGDGGGSVVALTRPVVPGDVLIVVQRLGACTSHLAWEVNAVCKAQRFFGDPSGSGLYAIGRADYSLSPITIGTDSVRRIGRVHFPMDPMSRDKNRLVPWGGKFPLVIVLHGNHGIFRPPGGADDDDCVNGGGWPEAPSYRGYDYILDALARNGYIAVSINANDLNCKADRIPERAALVLAHLALWKIFNDPTAPDPAFSGVFHNRVDLDNIGLLGHSRGGEAVVDAAQLNADPMLHIRAVLSLAPTDGHGFVQDRAPLLMVLPAADGDVSDNSGARIYDRARPGSLGDWFKSQFYIYGASHNQFNREWRFSDGSGAALMSRADQETLLRAWARTYFDHWLNHGTGYRPIFAGDAVITGLRNDKVYTSYQQLAALNMDDHEDAATLVNTLGGSLTQTFVLFNQFPFRQGGGAYNGTFFHDTKGLVATWNRPSSQYTSDLPAALQDVSHFKFLSFRVTEINDPLNPVAPMSFRVGIRDPARTNQVATSLIGEIPYPYDHGFVPDKSMMRTLRVPMKCLARGKSLLDLTRIRQVFFATDTQTGAAGYDQLSFSN